MKQVYTFSTGAIYLDELSSTKEGVKELVRRYVNEWEICYDDTLSIRDIFIDDKRIRIVVDDYSLKTSKFIDYELIILTVF